METHKPPGVDFVVAAREALLADHPQTARKVSGDACLLNPRELPQLFVDGEIGEGLHPI